MLKLYPSQETGHPPLEHGQVLEINPHCMKVNFGFRFIRGIFTGLVLSIISFRFFGELILFGGIQPTVDFVLRHSVFFPYIGFVALFEMYLWPSAPPMVFDRVNRRVIFQVLFRTNVISWDSCVASIQYVAQASESGATQTYNLRIEGEVINRKPGQKTQRAAALIHQSGISDDLLNYWEYIRHYMEDGPAAVPEPMKLYNRNLIQTPFKVYWAMLPRPSEIWEGLRHPKSIWTFFAELFFAFFLVVAIAATPLVVPLFMVHLVASKLGRVRRYPKEIRQLCKKGRKLAIVQPTQLDPNKLVIRIDGKPVEVDFPADTWKQSPSTKPPPTQ